MPKNNKIYCLIKYIKKRLDRKIIILNQILNARY